MIITSEQDHILLAEPSKFSTAACLARLISFSKRLIRA